MKEITINDISDYSKVIDIRENDEYAHFNISGTVHIPMMGLLMNPTNFLNKEETYYIMCASGGRSAMTCAQLSQQGYNVINVAGGIGLYQG